ncbi:MAG: hypothetical protein HFE77_03065 [Clostridiales bacterium]|nr:hypothetical protein [Clostridiales bacterium]
MKIKMMRNNKKSFLLKIAIMVLCIMLLLALVYGIAMAVNQQLQEKRNESDEINTDNFVYYFPDWEENIWQDEDYIEKDRTIYFQNGAETYPLSDIGSEGRGASFFMSYVDALIEGDYEALNHMYTSEYTDKNGLFEPFTKQKVYNVLVSYKGTAEGIDGYGKAEVFDLSYYIMKNNGTFRRDIESNRSRTQIIYLVQTNEGYKIYEVCYYKNRSTE